MTIAQPREKPHRTKEEYVYHTLRDAIMRCALKPGEKLVMDSLSDELGVSPIPIRGALQRLQAEGLVEIIPHTGAVISTISPENVNEIFMLLESLEEIAFSVAAEKATPKDIAHLRHLVAEMDAALQTNDAGRWYDLNNQFHLSVAQITEMKMLLRFTSRALDNRDRLRYFYLEQFISSRMAEAHAEHGQMIELLKSQDIEGLKIMVSQHNRKAKMAYQQVIEQAEYRNGAS